MGSKERLLYWLEELARSLLAVVLYCGVVGGAAYFAYGQAMRLLAVAQPAPTASPAAWQDASAANPALALDLEDFAAGAAQHRVQRHPAGGRRDIVIWALEDTQEPVLAIDVYRPGAEEPADPLQAAGFAAFAPALDGPQSLLSKFGPFEVRRGKDTEGRLCLGFTQASAEAVRLAGLYCGRVEIKRALETVACALDRLTLVNAHGDPRLAGVFARAHLRQSSCEPGKLPDAAIPQRSAWIDADGVPSLRAERR